MKALAFQGLVEECRAPVRSALRIRGGRRRPIFVGLPDSGRRDRWIGLGVSLVFHLGLLFGDTLLGRPQPKPVVETVEVPQLEMIAWPTVEYDEPEMEDGGMPDESPVTALVAPPRLMEAPRLVPLDPSMFVMPASRVPSAEMSATGRQRVISTLTDGLGMGAGRRFAGVFELSDLDQVPEVRSQPLPLYPPELQRVGVTGEVLVSFVVDAQGQVCRLRIVSATRSEFEQPALRAVAQWRFRPGKKAGRPVSTRMEAPIAFSLNSTR